MLEIGVMQTAMHNEVLSGIIGQHNHASSEVCFYFIELEKG